MPAATVTWEKAEPVAGNPDLDLAETSIDDSVPAEPAVSDPADTMPAVGGPFEEVASADLRSRPASQNYPACPPAPATTIASNSTSRASAPRSPPGMRRPAASDGTEVAIAGGTGVASPLRTILAQDH